MQLEAGLRKREELEDGKDRHAAVRRGNGGWGAALHGAANYEHWVKLIALGSLGVWVIFALFFWHTGAAAGRQTAHKTRDFNAQPSILNGFPEATNFIAFGDFGTGDENQRKVALALENYTTTMDPPPAFVLSTGDQIYDHGLVRLGGDGCYGELLMTSRAGAITRMNEQSSVKTRQSQYEWIEQTLSAGKPAGVERMWTIVMGHWGVYSFAGNADTPELIDMLDPMLKKYKVHAYFNGHDHSMQHVRKMDTDGSVRNYFISGAGGYRIHGLQPNARANPDLVHAALTHGFMSVHMTRTHFRVQLVDDSSEVLYTTDVRYE
ncbi:unnamed protein product [Phytophthora fragariaefolia]|uniref:Unnamed protein product n=1 Tax=Phytophthora fragariaefolia TaxID=1490495 RepID=A0A9W6TTQ9_9STRA|nr:unnamed protein product [Phytophthora fragariaefolia]